VKDNAVILFLRIPEKGKVKTRLAVDIGEDLAYDLYLCFVKDTLATLQSLDADVLISCTGRDSAFFRDLFGDTPCMVQRGNDLGGRMRNAFRDAFLMGYARVALIGSDIPGITLDALYTAFHELSGHDVVFGPSLDGGYYLIALKAGGADESLFTDIPWGTTRVLDETVKRVQQRGMRVFFLTECEDIDDLDGLKRLYENQVRDGVLSNTRLCVDRYKERIYGTI
jgi:rSAM/selenodomain-associated transferase 1